MNNKKTLIAVLGPLGGGIFLALLFLAFYVSKKKVVLVIHNRTGVDMLSGGVRLESEIKEEEVGPIANGDSTVFQFRDGGSGEFLLTGKLRTGTEFRISGGRVAKGTAARDAVVLGMADGTVTGGFTQGLP